MSYPSRLMNRPLALWEGFLPVMQARLHDGVPAAYLDRVSVEPAAEAETLGDIAIVPVRGMLTNSRDYWFCGSSYAQITTDFLHALHDDSVKAIVLHVDSPGGDVAGCAEVGDLIFASRGTKPIVAVCDATACSAAYWIASAADSLTVPQHGYSGNIGAIALHFDLTKALGNAGVTVTTIRFGAQKGEGYPTTPLTDGAIARMQADVDAMGESFVAAVARNRGLSPKVVRDTEAHAYLGAASVAAGLADAVMSPMEAFAQVMNALHEA